MQFDMFGTEDDKPSKESAPPVLVNATTWMPPEAIALNTALVNGALAEAVAIGSTVSITYRNGRGAVAPEQVVEVKAPTR